MLCRGTLLLIVVCVLTSMLWFALAYKQVGGHAADAAWITWALVIRQAAVMQPYSLIYVTSSIA